MKRSIEIKQRVVLRTAHFRPHMVQIIMVAFATQPETTDGKLVITEGWRDIRDSLDFHEHCAAFDFRCKNLVGASQEERERQGHAWAAVMRERLGSDYDVIAHGEGDNFHVHAEFDPR